jgi:hypothetical protein
MLEFKNISLVRSRKVFYFWVATRKKSKDAGHNNSLHINLHVTAATYFWWLYVAFSTQAAFLSSASAIYGD